MESEYKYIYFDNRFVDVKRNVPALLYALFGMGYKWHVNYPNGISFDERRFGLRLELKTKKLDWFHDNKKERINDDINFTLTATNLPEVIAFVEKELNVKPVIFEQLNGKSAVEFTINEKEKTVGVKLASEDGYIIKNPFTISANTVKRIYEHLFPTKEVKYNVVPVVQFPYPDSTTGAKRIRTVRVTSVDGHYICGFEVGFVSDDKPGAYKKFSLKKITTDISLVDLQQG